MPFDPCREWLGIDATDLKDPHRVLGIPPTETDGDTIARLAEQRLSQLAQISPGPFAKAHAALMTRVAESRDTLLATASWESSSAEMDVPTGYVPPPPPVLSPPAPPVTTFIPSPAPSQLDPAPLLDSASGFSNVVPFGVAAEQVIEAAESPSEIAPIPAVASVRRSPSFNQSSESAGGAGLGLFAIMLALALGIGYYAYKRLDVEGRGWAVALNSSDSQPVAPSPSPAVPVSVEPGATTQSAEPPLQSAPPPEEPAASAPPDTTVTLSPVASPSAPDEVATPTPPLHDPAEIELERAAERARIAPIVETALGDAYAALQSEDFDSADRLIQLASEKVGDDGDLAARIERWRLLARYARDFMGYRASAYKAANAGRDYEIDERLVAVIEITSTRFIYKLDGRVRRDSIDEVHPRLEMAVVEQWFSGDGRASNFLFVAARWLCRNPPNLPRAETALEKAAKGGGDASSLRPLLEDPIILRAKRQ